MHVHSSLMLLAAAMTLSSLCPGVPQEQDRYQRLIARLDTLTVTGGSRGGPYVGITDNEATKAIVKEGNKIVPALIAHIDKANVPGAIFTVYCLRQLRAKSATVKIQELRKALERGTRFAGVRRDLTLEVQIKYFLRDAKSW
jgi:hypothetical protein